MNAIEDFLKGASDQGGCTRTVYEPYIFLGNGNRKVDAVDKQDWI